MSVTPSFKHTRPFPFDIPEMTESEIVALATDFFGSGFGVAARLTGDLDFAKSIYWNIEQINTTISGVSLIPSVTISDYPLSSFFTQTISFVAESATPARDRVHAATLGARANHPDNISNNVGFLIYFPIAGFVYNTTTEEYNIIFEAAASVGECFAITDSAPADGTIDVVILGQEFTMQTTFGAGGGSGESIGLGDVTASYFTYAP